MQERTKKPHVCECGKGFWTPRGLKDHCYRKKHKPSRERTERKISTLEYLLMKDDAQSDDNFSF